MNDGHPPYEIRYGWNARTVRWAVVFLLLVAAPLAPGAPLWAESGLSAIGLACLGVTTLLAFRRPLALRVGPEGLTLGGTPFGLRTERMSWPDVACVHLWTEPVGRFGTMPYVGVRHRTGAAAQRDLPDSPATRPIDEYLTTQVAPEFLEAFRGTVLSSRAMGFWRLDPSELETAVREFAPHVHVFGDGAGSDSRDR